MNSNQNFMEYIDLQIYEKLRKNMRYGLLLIS